MVLILDVFHRELGDAAREKIRQQMAEQNEREGFGDNAAAPESSPRRDAQDEQQQSEARASAPAQARARAPALAGGYRVGDRVRSLLSQSDRSALSAGDSGVVVAPGEAADRLFVDFGEKRWHLLAHTVMREEEHAAERSGASLGTEPFRLASTLEGPAI